MKFMKEHPNVTIAAFLVVSIAVGAIQGQRLDRLIEADAFYQWMIAAATAKGVDPLNGNSPVVIS